MGDAEYDVAPVWRAENDRLRRDLSAERAAHAQTRAERDDYRARAEEAVSACEAECAAKLAAERERDEAQSALAGAHVDYGYALSSEQYRAEAAERALAAAESRARALAERVEEVRAWATGPAETLDWVGYSAGYGAAQQYVLAAFATPAPEVPAVREHRSGAAGLLQSVEVAGVRVSADATGAGGIPFLRWSRVGGGEAAPAPEAGSETERDPACCCQNPDGGGLSMCCPVHNARPQPPAPGCSCAPFHKPEAPPAPAPPCAEPQTERTDR